MSQTPEGWFEGVRCGNANVVVFGRRALDPACDVHTSSRRGFDWGDDRAESAQLAVAMLWAITHDEALVLAAAGDFHRGIVAALRGDWWQMEEEDVRRWVRDWAHRNHYTSTRLPPGVAS